MSEKKKNKPAAALDKIILHNSHLVIRLSKLLTIGINSTKSD